MPVGRTDERPPGPARSALFLKLISSWAYPRFCEPSMESFPRVGGAGGMTSKFLEILPGLTTSRKRTQWRSPPPPAPWWTSTVPAVAAAWDGSGSWLATAQRPPMHFRRSMMASSVLPSISCFRYTKSTQGTQAQQGRSPGDEVELESSRRALPFVLFLGRSFRSHRA